MLTTAGHEEISGRILEDIRDCNTPQQFHTLTKPSAASGPWGDMQLKFLDTACVIENNLGSTIYAKHPNGRIMEIHSRNDKNVAKVLTVLEYYDPEKMMTKSIIENGSISINPRDEYDLAVREFYSVGVYPQNDKSHHTDYCPYTHNERKLNGTRNFISKTTTLENVLNHDRGFRFSGCHFMFFLDKELAEETPHFYAEEYENRDPLEAFGLEITISSNDRRFTSLYLPFLDSTRKIKVNTDSTLPNEEVRIRYKYFLDTNEKEIVCSITDLLEGEGKGGIRLYETEQEAKIDNRKPETQYTKDQIKKNEQFLKVEKAKLEQKFEEFKEEQAKEKVKLEKELEELKSLHKAEKEKAARDARWSKAKDSTGFLGKVADFFGAIGGFFGRMFGFAF